jgi:hypothetical protein
MCDVISADSHLDFWYLPGDLFVSEARAEWKGRMPRVDTYAAAAERRRCAAMGFTGAELINCFATYERDAVGVRLLDLLGEDNIMRGSDYPHPDGTWPESQRFIERDFGGVPDKVRQKVVHDNAAKLYGLS